MYPVVIFPEGTTSNGRQLVKFHKGAFLCRVPVQPVVLQYKFWNCDPSFTDVPAFKTALRTIWSLYTVLKVTYLPVYYPSEEEIMNADLYAANVRHAMATAVNLKERDDSLSDKFAYLKIAAKDRRLPSC
jgi:lysophosphatidylcholine acyltransferase/lyso-PAF acetyltransferase